MTTEKRPLLEVVDLSTQFVGFGGTRIVRAVRNVSFSIQSGDSAALIGESGCGKTTVVLSILKVLPPAAQITGGKILFDGEDLLIKTPKEMTKIRGKKISMILQDPVESLNPVLTVGDQLGESLRYHQRLRGQVLIDRMKKLLLDVQIPEPERRIRQWPHEMSGGMRQRIVGAIALSCEPGLLIADEPTTNLDVTIQLQYLNLLRDTQERTGITLLFITHDLGIVAEMCGRVIVMYAGEIVEQASVVELFEHPAHPYSRALIDSAFGLEDLRKRGPISGEPPDPSDLPSGCAFHPRCPESDEACRRIAPPEICLSETRTVRCLKYAER